MAKIKAVLFDFNGTLFWDSTYHDKAWRNFAKTYASKDISEQKMKDHIHGRTNPDILSYVFGRTLDKEEAERFAYIKEKTYIDYINSEDGINELAPGAIKLLEDLKQNNIAYTIATSSDKGNVDFYFRQLKLDQWFDYNKIVYNDGTFNPKPAPDIFLKAAQKLCVDIHECLVVEDSVAGIKSARSAGANTVIYIENDTPVDFSAIEGVVEGKINHFNQLIKFLC